MKIKKSSLENWKKLILHFKESIIIAVFAILALYFFFKVLNNFINLGEKL